MDGLNDELGNSTEYISRFGIYDIRYELAAVLFHELVHANDFIPSSAISYLNRNETPSSNISGINIYRPAYKLQLPLFSSTMSDLAAVNFRGTNTPSYLESLSATQVSTFFEFDGANDEYNYNSAKEDVAMLFEEVMIEPHFNIDRDIAFVTKPENSTDSCSDYIVDWGRRNRAGNDWVKNRAKRVVDPLLPNSEMDAFFLNLTQPIGMTVGQNWCENLVQGRGR